MLIFKIFCVFRIKIKNCNMSFCKVRYTNYQDEFGPFKNSISSEVDFLPKI
jgi:hypothetical protein